MHKTASKKSKADVWSDLSQLIKGDLPHLYSWLEDSDSFVELRIKATENDSCLAIAKGYGTDGGPVVCFGVGYGVVASLLAIDSTINGGRWKIDEPWEPKND